MAGDPRRIKPDSSGEDPEIWIYLTPAPVREAICKGCGRRGRQEPDWSQQGDGSAGRLDLIVRQPQF